MKLFFSISMMAAILSATQLAHAICVTTRTPSGGTVTQCHSQRQSGNVVGRQSGSNVISGIDPRLSQSSRPKSQPSIPPQFRVYFPFF